jgi:hypothetical protein
VSEQDEVTEAHIQRLLAEHEDITEQGITVDRRGTVTVLCGCVETATRRDEIVRLVSRHFPDTQFEVEIEIAEARAPAKTEELA